MADSSSVCCVLKLFCVYLYSFIILYFLFLKFIVLSGPQAKICCSLLILTHMLSLCSPLRFADFSHDFYMSHSIFFKVACLVITVLLWVLTNFLEKPIRICLLNILSFEPNFIIHIVYSLWSFKYCIRLKS